MSFRLLLLIGFFFFHGCSERVAESQQRPTIYKEQFKALEKAKNTEKVLNDAFEARKKQIEGQGN